MTSFWISCQGEQLEQGDHLPGCWIPVIGADFDPSVVEAEIAIGRSNLVIVTQSCDLANDKIQLAALCPMGGLRVAEVLLGQAAMTVTDRVLGSQLAQFLGNGRDAPTTAVVVQLKREFNKRSTSASSVETA